MSSDFEVKRSKVKVSVWVETFQLLPHSGTQFGYFTHVLHALLILGSNDQGQFVGFGFVDAWGICPVNTTVVYNTEIIIKSLIYVLFRAGSGHYTSYARNEGQ